MLVLVLVFARPPPLCCGFVSWDSRSVLLLLTQSVLCGARPGDGAVGHQERADVPPLRPSFFVAMRCARR